MIELYERVNGEFELVGQIVDGVYEGDEGLSYVEGWSRERILSSLDGPNLIAVEEDSDSKSLFGKSKWMPYSGPQGGVGWKNVDTDEVVYAEEPPGDVYIPGDYPADLNFDIEIGDISEGDLLLIPGEEGDVDATLAENLGADQSWYGRLENVDPDELLALDIDPNTVSEVTVADDSEEVFEDIFEDVQESDGSQQQEDVEDESESTEDESEPEDGVTVPKESLASPKEHEYQYSGSDMAVEIAKVWELEKTDYSFNPDEIKLQDIDFRSISSIPMYNPDYNDLEPDASLADLIQDDNDEVMSYKLQNLFNEMEERYGDGGTITGEGAFVPNMIANVPEGTSVKLEMWDGDVVHGTLSDVDGDFADIDVLGSSYPTNVEIQGIDRAEIVSREEQTVESTDFSKPGSVIQYIEAMDTDNFSSYGVMKEIGKTVGQMYKAGASADDAFQVADRYVDDRRDVSTVIQFALKDTNLESDVMDVDGFDMYASSRTQSTFNKTFMKSFENKYPEHEQYLNDLDSAVSDWTGDSKNEETAIFWTVAHMNGEDNIPSVVADEIDKIQGRDDSEEYLEAANAYIEHTRDFLREQFGDEITMYRGIRGDYGKDRVDNAEENGSTVADHRAIASWTWNPIAADKFSNSSGAAFCKTIDVDDVYMAFSGGVGFQEEFEIVAAGGLEDYEYVDDQKDLKEGTVIRGRDMNHEDDFKMAWEHMGKFGDN